MSEIAINKINLLAFIPEIIWAKSKTEKQIQKVAFSSIINGISKFELPYVYHHLHIGRKLSIEIKDSKVGVYYRAHKLGELPFISSKRLVRLLENGYSVGIAVKNLKKEKCFSINEIQVSLKFSKK